MELSLGWESGREVHRLGGASSMRRIKGHKWLALAAARLRRDVCSGDGKRLTGMETGPSYHVSRAPVVAAVCGGAVPSRLQRKAVIICCRGCLSVANASYPLRLT